MGALMSGSLGRLCRGRGRCPNVLAMTWMAPPHTAGDSIARQLVDRTRSDPGRPLVTYLDQDAGRMELSAASVANGAAKAAGLLRDELDIQPGNYVNVDLPRHWQSSIWCAALSLVGAVAELGPLDANSTTVIDSSRAIEAQGSEIIAVSLAPFGLPSTDPLPDHAVDAAIAARAHADFFTPHVWPDNDAIALRYNRQPSTNAQVSTQARGIAAECGLRAGGRLLVTAPPDPADVLEQWLLLLAVPLIADAAVVLMHPHTREDAGAVDHIRNSEGITATYGT